MIISEYLALAFAPTIQFVLAAYGLLLGVGMALCGTLIVNLLVNNWF